MISSRPPKAGEMDEALHRARVGSDKRQVRMQANVANLPDGTFVSFLPEPEVAWLVWRDHLHRWSHVGYREVRPVVPSDDVVVLTPEATVKVLRAGYKPLVHPTAEHIVLHVR